MDRRLELQEKLESVLRSNNVYYQPPESVKLRYPCIVYQRYSGRTLYANDKIYRFTRAYQVTIITEDPDEAIGDRLMEEFKMVRYSNHFVSDNLNHEVYILYY